MANERLLEILHLLRIVGDPATKGTLIDEAMALVEKPEAKKEVKPKVEKKK